MATTVKVVVCGVLVVLVKAPEIMVPSPLDAKPVRFVVLSRVQWYSTSSDTIKTVESATLAMLFPEQILWLTGTADTIGFGLTNSVTEKVLPIQVP